MIFQDPWSALNPIMTVGAQLIESAQTARRRPAAEARATAIKALQLVGVSDPERRMSSYPREMSGGILQRIVIAMAVLAEPALLICDEPTTALDVTTETQIMELIKELNAKLGTSVILTTHDMSLIEEYCNRIIIMYAGAIVEIGTVEACFKSPKHPYTRSLLVAVPEPGLVAPMTDLPTLEGTPPSPQDIGAGCSFAPRCPHRMEKCATQPPLFRTDAQGGVAACWLLEDIAA
jgi:oligopeptide/dipeptide ABC transporter ATP-binding protein